MNWDLEDQKQVSLCSDPPLFNKCLLNTYYGSHTMWDWRRKWLPLQYSCLQKSHGWRSLVGYSPWGRKESDTAEQLHFLSIVAFGVGNGSPPWCSCLEHPMDRGAWWATVYEVAKSQTQLSN